MSATGLRIALSIARAEQVAARENLKDPNDQRVPSADEVLARVIDSLLDAMAGVS